MNVNEMSDYLVDMGICTQQELELVTSINGWSEESMEDILYARTGYESFDQIGNYIDSSKKVIKNSFVYPPTKEEIEKELNNFLRRKHVKLGDGLTEETVDYISSFFDDDYPPEDAQDAVRIWYKDTKEYFPEMFLASSANKKLVISRYLNKIRSSRKAIKSSVTISDDAFVDMLWDRVDEFYAAKGYDESFWQEAFNILRESNWLGLNDRELTPSYIVDNIAVNGEIVHRDDAANNYDVIDTEYNGDVDAWVEDNGYTYCGDYIVVKWGLD